MWFRNLVVYRLAAGWNIDAAAFDAQLRKFQFVPGLALEEASIGWAPPREGDDSLVVSTGRQLLIALRTEKKLLPPKVINQVLKERLEKFEAEEGYKPGRKRVKEMRDAVRDELLPRAFSLASDLRAWIDPVAGWLVVDAASMKRAGELLALLIKSIEDVPVQALRVSASPAGEMTAWLVAGDAPANFTIDQDLVLNARDGKASVRYANQTIEASEVERQTRAGMICSRLALTWASRVSFVLTDKLEIKRVRPLDVLKENESTEDRDAQARFESDFTLMTGELGKLLAEVIDVLGGHEAEQRKAA